MSFTNESKNSTSFTNSLKESTSFSNSSKNSTLFSSWNKETTVFDSWIGYLQKEDTFYLLLETGYKIILNQSWNNKYFPTFTNISK